MGNHVLQWAKRLMRMTGSGAPDVIVPNLSPSQADSRRPLLSLTNEESTSERAWDVFISHASEDKLDVAEPLAALLQEVGFAVWYDRFELRIGSSLREKIDEGLALSRYGIVILSPNFFGKQWPRAELAGLVSSASWSSLLPIWHHVTQEDVRRFSPILADRVAADTSAGLRQIAREITRVIDDNSHGTSAVDHPTRTTRFRRTLERAPDLETVRHFLAQDEEILMNAFGTGANRQLLIKDCELGDSRVDFAIGRRNRTAGYIDWHFLVLGRVQLDFSFNESGTLEPTLGIEIELIRSARKWVTNNLSDARKRLPDLQPGVGATILAGRRDSLTVEQRQSVTALRDTLPAVTIRTYDWLVETSAERDGRSR